jgi:7,8-dihydropterin-6-yl-methyl-4-(beta-D-ribofuranosyl)aminobenzene 5'-phosphate synthase
MKTPAHKPGLTAKAAVLAGALAAGGAVFYAYRAFAPVPPAVQEIPEIVFARHGGRQELTARYERGRTEAEADWGERQARARPLDGLGGVDSLEILPLVEMNAAPGLLAEPGVAYLLRAGGRTILFDLGLNEADGASPLLHNMEKLGVKKERLTDIFISHPHRDHVGGHRWERRGTFALGHGQPPLPGVRIYTPVPLTYPGSVPLHIENPAVLAPGIASIGVIGTFDYFTGMISEAALAVNVKGKGIVLVVGCGHQGLDKLIARSKKIFREPLYAVIGGLHYPVSGSRLKIRGVDVQKYFGTGRPPWVPVTLADVRKGIKALKAERVKVVAVSPHDSCDAALGEFRAAFPSEWRELAAGEPIRI